MGNMRILALCALLFCAAPARANGLAAKAVKPVSLRPGLAVPGLRIPLTLRLGAAPGAVSLRPSLPGAQPAASVVPSMRAALAARESVVVSLIPPAAARPAAVESPAPAGRSRVTARAASAFNNASKDFRDDAGGFTRSAAFDGAAERPQAEPRDSPEELAFAARASWLLGRTADELGAQRGLASSRMSTRDFVALVKAARDKLRREQEAAAPSPRAFRAALAVMDSVVRVVDALGAKDEPLNAKVRRILSVWQVFNQAMAEAAERGTLGDIIGEAKLFAHQVEDSVETRPPLRVTENGVVAADSIEEGLRALREASHPMDGSAAELLGKLRALHPELPLDPERVFLVKDQALLDMLDLPADAAGAARILSDGTRREKFIVLAAKNGIAADDFVEFVLHEAVHLLDEGILLVAHKRSLEHGLAEGYTQLRAHELANAALTSMGRKPRANPAYSREVDLVRRLIAKHGEAPLAELVRSGSTAGLKAALGERWKYVRRLIALDARSASKRDDLLSALFAVALSPEFDDAAFDWVLRRFGLA